MWWVCTAPPLLTRCRATCQLTSVVPGRRAASPAACWGRSAWSVCCIENMWDRWAEGRADRCVSDIWTGVLQLSASGDLPANDWSTVAGRGPGQSGAIHAAAACPLRLLSVSVPRAEGGARCTHAAVTTACCNGNGDSALPWRPHAVVTTMTHCHDNRLFAVAMSTCCCNNTHTLPWQQPLAVRTTPNPAMATTTTRCHDNDTATYHCYYVNSRTNDDQSNKYLNQSQSQHDSSHTLTPPPLIPAATHTHTHTHTHTVKTQPIRAGRGDDDTKRRWSLLLLAELRTLHLFYIEQLMSQTAVSQSGEPNFADWHTL